MGKSEVVGFMAPSSKKRMVDDLTGRFLELGIPKSEAKQYAKATYADAVERQRSAKTPILSDNCGEEILKCQFHYPPMLPYNYREIVGAEGVRESDIRCWWNRPDIERWCAVAFDDFYHTAQTLRYVEEYGLDDAFSRLTQDQPFFIYGLLCEEDDPHFSGEDRRLPYELKVRALDYLERRASQDKDSLDSEVKKYSSMNAFIRAKIVAGEI